MHSPTCLFFLFRDENLEFQPFVVDKKAVVQSHQQVTIIAEDVEGEALATLLVTMLHGIPSV
jgi:chaperonin GroEL (HSP60 family)